MIIIFHMNNGEILQNAGVNNEELESIKECIINDWYFNLHHGTDRVVVNPKAISFYEIRRALNEVE